MRGARDQSARSPGPECEEPGTECEEPGTRVRGARDQNARSPGQSARSPGPECEESGTECEERAVGQVPDRREVSDVAADIRLAKEAMEWRRLADEDRRP